MTAGAHANAHAMTIKYIILVNKQGCTRLARYADASLSPSARAALEGEIVRKCLARSDKLVSREGEERGRERGAGARAMRPSPSPPFLPPQCSFVDHGDHRVVYRRYASLFFLVGVDAAENELAALEFIHALVEALDRHFGAVCELDIMFNLETVHYVLDEMVSGGCVVDGCRANVLAPVQLLERSAPL